MNKTLSISSITAPPTILGNSPIWCGVTNTFLYVDTVGKAVLRYNPTTQKTDIMKFDQYTGFVVPTAATTSDELIVFVGLEDRILEVNFTYKNIIRVIYTVTGELAVQGRFACAKCSEKGILYTIYTQMTSDGPLERLFRLNLIDSRDINLQLVHGPKSMFIYDWKEKHGTIGLCFFHNTLYLIESKDRKSKIIAFTLRNDDLLGYDVQLVNERIILSQVDTDLKLGHLFDGLTVDNSGKLWVTISGAGCIIRVDPDNGKIMNTIHIPVFKPTSCIFGKDVLVISL
jgi:sugar lactone lactonase YvrE